MIRGLNFPSKALHVTSYSAVTLSTSGFNAIGPIHSFPTWSHWHFSVSHIPLTRLVLPPQEIPQDDKSKCFSLHIGK